MPASSRRITRRSGPSSRPRAIAESTGSDPDLAAPWPAVRMVSQACDTCRDASDDVPAWVGALLERYGLDHVGR